MLTSTGDRLHGRVALLVGTLALTVSVAYGVLFYGFSVLLSRQAAGGEFSNTVLSAAYGGAALVMDAHLAAPAMEHGALLCSTDRDFTRFPRLRFTNPLA
ncbi:MAG: hypothetical protein ACRDU8_08600 [Egibacteraceae bacterium]